MIKLLNIYNQVLLESIEDKLTIRFSKFNKEILWFYNGKKVGLMHYIVRDNIVIIVGYRKENNLQSGLGYEFIKKSFDSLLKEYNGVFSSNLSRNDKSNHVWDKLSKIYKVENINYQGSDGKIIYSNKSINESIKSKSAKGNRYFEMLKTAKFQHYDSPKGELSTFNKGEEDRKRLVSKLSVEDKKKYKEWLTTDEGKESIKLFKKYETKFNSKVLKENINGQIKFTKSNDEDYIKIYANYNGQKIGHITMEMMSSAYWYFEDDFSEEEYDEFFPHDKLIKIEHLEIEDNYKGSGIAKELMKRALITCKKLGYNEIYLNASPMGFSGLNLGDLTDFYKRFGFWEIKHQGNNVQMYTELK